MSDPRIGDVRCRSCGAEVGRNAIRLTEIQADGQADFHHLVFEGERVRSCGPLILARLGRPTGLQAERSLAKDMTARMPPLAKNTEPTSFRINLDAIVKRYEQRLVLWALTQEKQNQQAASERLGLKRTTLVAKLRRWNWKLVHNWTIKVDPSLEK